MWNLFGVVPRGEWLDPLLQCQMLESVRVSKYPDQQRPRFYKIAEVTDNFAPRPPVEGW